jgi:hypothetical protein
MGERLKVTINVEITFLEILGSPKTPLIVTTAKLCMVVHVWNPSTCEAETGRL